MLNALNTAATGMTAQAKQVEVSSNNLANADTVSFKKSRAEFQDLLYQNMVDPGAATSATTQNPTGVQVGVGVKLAATSREHTQGTLRPTGRNMDIAIGGEGFLSFQSPAGEIVFSRDGSLQVNNEGRVVNSQGYPLVPEVVIPPGIATVSIGTDGRVTASTNGIEKQDLGQIQLSNFSNPAGLQAEGGNMFRVSSGSGAPVPGNPGEQGFGILQQQFLEASNVAPVTEMTDLIRAQRVYELNSKIISTSDAMMSTLNQLK